MPISKETKSAGPVLIHASLPSVVRATVADAMVAEKLLKENPNGPIEVAGKDAHFGLRWGQGVSRLKVTSRTMFTAVPGGTTMSIIVTGSYVGVRRARSMNVTAPSTAQLETAAREIEVKAKAIDGV